VEDFEIIRRELDAFPGAGDDTPVRLAAKPQLAAANKIDAVDDWTRVERLAAHLRARDIPFFPVSAVTGDGVPALVEAMWREVSAAAREARAR
jgi:GTP-binding protein